MRNLQIIAVQLLEAVKLLEAGSPEHLRLALILLDNAAELQLRWAALSELERDETYERMRRLVTDTIKRSPEEELPEPLREIATRKPLPEDFRSRLNRFFDDKVRYLTRKDNQVTVPLAETLRFLHEYRSRAKHAGVLDRGLLRVLVCLFLEVNCVLLETLRSSGTVWASNEDYSFLKEEFCVTQGGPEKRQRVARRIRLRFPLELKDIVDALASELRGRIKTVRGYLEVLVGMLKNLDDEAAALAEAQFYAYLTAAPGTEPLSREQFQPKHDLEDLARLERRVGTVESSPNSIDAFRRFAQIVKLLEPIETVVAAFLGDIEERIQLEIDLRRGK